ncbi:amiloride-sensitive sodium channel subunit gamma [Ambystoma mexicanum]|uniref:amiloride-sensitive sodium channel subunit gamma n=1 Tax=Ambystoma mexicanum TaxID=8296 RepID=UPI0037E8DA17
MPEHTKKKLKEKLKKNLPVTGPQAPTLYELMQWYCLTTNTHGCRRIVVSKGRLRRLIWILLTLVAVGLIFWQCALLIMSFYSVSVSITVTFQKLVFPAVTICSLNPYKYSQIKPYLANLEEKTIENLKNLYGYADVVIRQRRDTDAAVERSYSEADRQLEKIKLVRIKEIQGEYVVLSDIPSGKIRRMKSRMVHRDRANGQVNEGKPTVGFQLCDQFNASDCTTYTFSSGVNAIQAWYLLHYMNMMAQVPMDKKIASGYAVNELLVTCFFDGTSCNTRTFKLFHHPLYGNCYTFNSGEDGTPLSASTGGSSYGLQVVIYTDEEEYNPFLSIASGAKILVHGQDEYPFMEDVGTDIETSLETSIGLQLTESSKLSSPYSDCTIDGSDIPVTNIYNKSYSYQTCIHSCFQQAMVDVCGCAHYNQPLPLGAQFCNYNIYPNWMYCYLKLHADFVQEDLGCHEKCRERCSNKEWTLTRSTAQWPSVTSEDWMLRVLTREMGDKIKKNLTKNDLANLGIFYKDLNLRSISESPANSIATLLSNFGGQLGLWMSCSVVCVIEIVEIFFVDSFWVFARLRWQKLRKRWQQKKEERLEHQASASQAPVAADSGHDNPVCLRDEDPPTFNTALSLPLPSHCQIPRTPPPKYNTLRIQKAFPEKAEDTEDSEDDTKL